MKSSKVTEIIEKITGLSDTDILNPREQSMAHNFFDQCVKVTKIYLKPNRLIFIVTHCTSLKSCCFSRQHKR